MDKKTEKTIDEKNQATLLESMAVAFEFGYRCAEKGMNLQAAMAHFQKTMQGK